VVISTKVDSSAKSNGLRLRISQERDCPLYNLGDQFQIQGTGLLAPHKKPVCILLAENLRHKKKLVDSGRMKPSELDFMCEGCGEHSSVALVSVISGFLPEDVEILLQCLHQFSFFRVIPKYIVEEIYQELSIDSYDAGTVIIEHGSVGHSVYVVVSGEVEVYVGDNKSPIANYKAGGLFGEMSLLTGNVCNANVETISETRLLTIKANTFNFLLDRFPELQKYFYRLLSSKFNKTNSLTSTIETSEMNGNLQKWPLPDLLETIHKSEKTGRLQLELESGRAYIDFLEGEVISAYCNNESGITAFLSLFSYLSADFSFLPHLVDPSKAVEPLGMFLPLLMEGLVQADQAALNRESM